MIISDKQKVVYIAPPKTGSVAVSTTMLNSEVFCGYNPNIESIHHHKTQLLPRKKNYFHFITVRHPYLRAYSFWRFMWKEANRSKHDFFAGLFPKHLGYISFTRWLHEGPTNRNKRDLFFKEMKDLWRCHWHIERLKGLSVHVVHLETLEDDLRVVPGFDKITSIPRINSQEPEESPWYDNFTPKDIRRIQELWAGDFYSFGYTKDFEKVKAGQYFTED